MNTPLRVLLVEDSEDDARLIAREIQSGGYDVDSERVDTRTAVMKSLKRRPWDIIICDNSLPQLSAMDVVTLLEETGYDTPLIIVSGTISEEAAVTALKAGAQDFLLKDHLARLIPAIQRELRSVEIRRERRQAEGHIRELAAIVENSEDAIFTKTLKGIITSWNKGAEQIYGYSAGEIVGQPVSILMPPERQNEMPEILGKIQLGESVDPFETERIRKDGRRISVSVTVSPVRDPQSKVSGASSIARDITERKQAQEQVRQMEQRFRALTENAPDGIVLIGVDGLTKFASPSAERILGYSSGEVRDISLVEHTHRDDLPAVLSALTGLIQNPTQSPTLQYRFKRKDGTWVWMESTLTNLLTVKTVEAIVMNFRDITDRKQAENKIQQQIEWLTALREIDQLIVSTFGMQLSLNALLSRATKLLAVDAATVLLRSPTENMFEYRAGIGFRASAVNTARVKLGQDYAGTVAKNRRILHVESSPQMPDNTLLTGYLKEEGFVSYHGVPLITKGKVIGVFEVYNRSDVKRDADWLDFLTTLANQAAIAIDNAQLFNELQISNTELALAYNATIEGWSRALDLRDKETEGHTQRVTELTTKLARQLGFSQDELVHVHRGALLHDIGKMGVPDQILLKPGELTDGEWEIMKRHPVFAYELLSPIGYLRSAALDIPYCHHEKWDGTGYPRGLKGEQIPLAARIFAVVDVWDALTSNRPYRPAWPKDKVLRHIQENSERHFDPKVVEAFLNMIK